MGATPSQEESDRTRLKDTDVTPGTNERTKQKNHDKNVPKDNHSKRKDPAGEFQDWFSSLINDCGCTRNLRLSRGSLFFKV